MSFLTPLYVLGLSALIAPLVFHLIRRSPRGEVPFSSLMFLAPTPPRLTRRSRLDHLLLLFLRALALGLLAFAFARPFLREAARLGFGNVERRRVALLIDTSASMRRGGLWPRAVEQALKVIADCRPADQLAVFSFDTEFHPLLTFHESETLDAPRRDAIARGLVNQLAPSWGGGNLGQALVDAVSAIEEVADKSEKSGRMPRRVVLISDLAQGCRVEALGDFEWPSDVELDPKIIAEEGSNAGLATLEDAAGSDPAETLTHRRVRVFNDASSRRENFELVWTDETGKETADDPVSVYVAPGESRVVPVLRPRSVGANSNCFLKLRGDSHSFDNTVYFANERREEKTVVVVGPGGADDHAGLLFYLNRVFVDTPRRVTHVEVQAPEKPLKIGPPASLPLVILAADTGDENARILGDYVRSGGTVLFVATAAGASRALAVLAKVPAASLREAAARDVMLGQIKFDHPLFAPFSAPQFSDFTRIHFWKHRVLSPELLEGFTVLARFEGGDVAVAEKLDGQGRLVVFASGWQPVDSQLARSSKFVPLLLGLMAARGDSLSLARNHLVFDRVRMPEEIAAGKDLLVHKPDGSSAKVPKGSASFSDTDLPGLYMLEGADLARSFAVNVDPLESKTTAMQPELLEQLGCRLTAQQPRPLSGAESRQMFNAELENRQKLWRWLILAAIVVLFVETVLAGRRSAARRTALAEGVVT